jgi:hypothetical protein
VLFADKMIEDYFHFAQTDSPWPQEGVHDSLSGPMVRAEPIRRNFAFQAIVALQFWLLIAIPAMALDPSRAITQHIQSSWTTEAGVAPKFGTRHYADGERPSLAGNGRRTDPFDGVDFTVYCQTNTPGLPSNYIQALAAGRDGTLWIGSDTERHV